jgi:glycosyltransferase involved in cell wall biosynthesis
MNKLSVCLITKNEAGSLGACLASVLPVADEVVVVDTGSMDKTVEIAEQFGARVFLHEWKNDFSEARNLSLSLASHPWIMWIDADETLDPASIPVIKSIKETAPGKAYSCLCKNVNSCEAAQDFVKSEIFKRINIFPNFKGISFTGNLHERVRESVIDAVIPIEESNILINHHGYSDEKTVGEKILRDIKLMLVKLGFSHNQNYYEFSCNKKYNCLYAPNVLMVWYGLRMIGVNPVFTKDIPENADEKFSFFAHKADFLITSYEGALAEHWAEIKKSAPELKAVAA